MVVSNNVGVDPRQNKGDLNPKACTGIRRGCISYCLYLSLLSYAGFSKANALPSDAMASDYRRLLSLPLPLLRAECFLFQDVLRELYPWPAMAFGSFSPDIGY